MVKHIIIWTLKSDYDADEKMKICANIKNELEALKEKIDGIIDIKVQIDHLPSSNGDLMLDSSFENVDALKAYAVHPAHVEIADRDVRPFVASRSCLDFEI
jgi:type III secretory pathway lipoprotein EscJ